MLFEATHQRRPRVEEILLIIVTLLIAEIIIWELPQFLAKRVKLAAGLSICLVTSAFVAGKAFSNKEL